MALQQVAVVGHFGGDDRAGYAQRLGFIIRYCILRFAEQNVALLRSVHPRKKLSMLGKITHADIAFSAERHQRRGERFESETDDILNRVDRRLEDFLVAQFNDE